jgi:hypothetical protein
MVKLKEKKMESSLKFLNKSLNGYCAFIDEKYRLLVIAPQKCGSTSILKTLYDTLVEQSQEYESNFTHEYIKELCIHNHIKSIQDFSIENLKRIFSDQSYTKVLIIRDPVDRLCSAICSKYILNNSIFYTREIRDKLFGEKLNSQPYNDPNDFLKDFNTIANIIMTKGVIFGGEKASHASPISELIPSNLLPFFNEIIDVTNKSGWERLKHTINQHLNHIEEGVKIDSFIHVNENPLKQSKRFLSNQNLTIAYGRFSDDYRNFELLKPSLEDHHQTPPSNEELKSLNTFISLATRSIDLFNIGTSRIQETQDYCDLKIKSYSDQCSKEITKSSEIFSTKIKSYRQDCATKARQYRENYSKKLLLHKKNTLQKLSSLEISNKQLIYLEELSKRTAEQLLIESKELKQAYNDVKMELAATKNAQEEKLLAKENEAIDKLNKTLLDYFPFYAETSGLDVFTLKKRAEKRIRNKNYNSAKELLIQAYCMSKNHSYILLRIYAVSRKNSIFRAILLIITAPLFANDLPRAAR